MHRLRRNYFSALHRILQYFLFIILLNVFVLLAFQHANFKFLYRLLASNAHDRVRTCLRDSCETFVSIEYVTEMVWNKQQQERIHFEREKHIETKR